MDGSQFDRLARAFSTSRTRRGLAVLLAAASALPLLGPEGRAAKNNKKKGKGCKKNEKKCGKKCVPKSGCCYRHDCERERGCKNETCLNGKCQCGPELVMHNGICGFLLPCKSYGEPCADGDECCGRDCLDDGSGAKRCLGKSLYQCMADIDCKSGPCRGFLCPEALVPYFSLCPGSPDD